MAEQSGFFDAHLINGVYDRIYLADNFAKYFASFIGNGVFGGKSNELMVQQKQTANMSVRVLSGQGWINGYWYENTNEVSLDIPLADGVLNRIDLIVLRWDNAERVIRLAVKKGTPASIPSAPTLQRSADYYELKLAEITINAGTTKITQANILDTRLNTAVCGLVHAVVDQLDSKELGIQLDAYISEFIQKKDAWFSTFKTNSDSAVGKLLTDGQADIDDMIEAGETNLANVVSAGQTNINNAITAGNKKFDDAVAAGNTKINNVVNTGTTNINKLISDKTTEIDALIDAKETAYNEKVTEVDTLIDKFEETLADSDVIVINEKITDVDDRVKILESTSVESKDYAGCYYRVFQEEVEWINPPNAPNTEYKTTERWNNNKPVYQKTLYIPALSNKMTMSAHIDAAFDKIISITGFAIDSDNNMYYPFPIILNGFEAIAAITGAVGDGGEGSDITININEDLSAFKAYITVKYTKT